MSDTPKGAKASAAFYSLIETAKANGIGPNSYLKCIFTKLPHAKSIDDLKDLLSQYLDRNVLAKVLEGGVLSAYEQRAD